MPPYDLTILLIQGVPESLAFIFLVYALLGIRVSWTRVLLLGLLSLSLLAVVRFAGAPFPAHTLFSLIVMSVIVSRLEQVALQRVVLVWGCVLLALVVLETALSVVMLHLLGLSAEEVLAQPLLWALVGWPHIIAMALAAFGAQRRGGFWPFKANR